MDVSQALKDLNVASREELIQKLKELKVSLDAHIDRHLARIAKRLQKD